MNELEEKFYETGVVPVVVLEDAEDAVPLAQALVEGGLLSAEVTFRTAVAGAKFIVSPGFDPEIVDYCLEKKIPVLPGCISPSEVGQKRSYHCEILPGRAGWRNCHDQSDGSTVCGA